MIELKRPEVSITIEESIVVVKTQHMTTTLHLTNDELIALTAELYGLDPGPLLCGTAPAAASTLFCRCHG